MKHIFSLSSLLLAGGTLIVSCSSDDLIGARENVKRIEASLCDFVMEDGSTRTSYTLGSNGYEAVWATGDVLGIYPLGGDQVAFPISDGVGTTLAKFDGGAWALRGTYQYAAYYPFSTDNYTISETAIPVSYLGQTQTANNSVTHFAEYDFMAAAATKPDASGSVTLPFKHLSSYLILPLTLPKAGIYTQLTLTSNNGRFITKGIVDLSASSPAITATETSSSISINLDNIALTSDNLVLTANMLIAPVDLTGSTITITVTDSNGATYTNTEKEWTRSAAFLANTTYKASRTLAGSGTGGEIEGGGGLEEDDESANNHNYVDLGLPSGTLWATCNLGAKSSEEYGDYYAFGETCVKTIYNQENYTFEGSEISLDHDIAHILWGEDWCIPSAFFTRELIDYCTWESFTLNGVNGHLITGPNHNTIFLPYGGHIDDEMEDGLMEVESQGSYWCSTQDFSSFQYELELTPSSFDFGRSGFMWAGRNIRPVKPGHEYVDLGIKDDQGRTIYWATCNIGADKPEDVGMYFAWGDTQGYYATDNHDFEWGNYVFMEEGYSDWIHINAYTLPDNYKNSNWFDSDGNFIGDYKTVLELEDDAAHINWGGKWRMPTADELRLLCPQYYNYQSNNPHFTWTFDRATKGFTVTSQNGGSIFMPFSGRIIYTSHERPNDIGEYWSSSLGYSNDDGCTLCFYNSERPSDCSSVSQGATRFCGRPIRPVCVLDE